MEKLGVHQAWPCCCRVHELPGRLYHHQRVPPIQGLSKPAAALGCMGAGSSPGSWARSIH